MKLILLLFAVSGFNTFANTQYDVKSKIKSVVVYQQGAQIKRQGKFTVKKGITELKLSGISSEIDPNTLQVLATGNIVILDTRHSIFYPVPTQQNNSQNQIPLKIKKEIIALEDSLFDLSFSQLDVQNKIDVLNNQKRIIENNGTIKGIGKVNDSIPLLKNALSFYVEKMNEINSKLLKLNRKHILLNKKQTRMTTRLTTLNSFNQNNQLSDTQSLAPIDEIIITVSAKETVSGHITITYLVNGAGWIPLYDLRSTSKSKTIDLTYKAQVYQNTGVDWNTTKLSLSTNDPYANKTKPTLNPWYLNYQSAQIANKKKRSFNYSNESRRATVSDDLDIYSEQGAPSIEQEAMTADQFMTTVQQLVSVEYSIDLPYTILSNNQKNLILIKTTSLKTNYLYYTVPKLDPSVYLIAQITDLDELNLIHGKATIFHEGSYLGSTYIRPNIMSDTMELSLGKTTSITVKRHLIKKATKEKVVGDKIIKTYAYLIEIKNHGRQTADIVIEDQIPLSQNPDIEIEIENISKAKLNEVNGFIKWHTKLKPSGFNKYELVYTVKYEKPMQINLAAY